MKRTALYAACFFTTITAAHAQLTIKDDWDSAPKMHTVADTFAGADAVIVEEGVKLELKDEGDKVWMYRTLHRIIKLQNEKGIESFNKMSVPLYEHNEMKTLKARTILPDGKVFEVAKDKMKTSKGEDGSTEVVFAMEGVEKNAEIELLFCEKKPYTLFGYETFQYSVPAMHATFEMSMPKRLLYEEKGYNGFPTVHDTLIDKTRYLTASESIIPAIETEMYGMDDVNRSRAEYKLSYFPDDKENVREFTWKDLAKRLYENTYQLSDREKNAATDYLETLNVKSTDNELEKIKKIENGIKNNITYYKDIDDDNADHIDFIISKKSATESGLIRLYAACFTAAGVKHELGITSNRYEHNFDADFENWNNMENYLFYFPDQKNYLYPLGTYMRYPLVPIQVLSNKGVFLKLTTIGSITNAIADIRTINPIPAADSYQDITATITFTPDMDAMTDVTYSFLGYAAMGMREASLLLPKDKLKEMVEGIVNIADKPENIVKYTIANEAFENYYDKKPLQFTATVKTPQLVEKAGDKYLFKLGDVIGRQAELYQTNARKLPIDLDYPHYLDRTITIIIPDGYKVLNPETIKLTAEYKNTDGVVTTAFYSDYKLEGNKLIVTISEFYAQLHLPKSDYEPFRKVINASADFNKVNLLLAKQ